MKSPRSYVIYGSATRTHPHQDAVSVRTKKGERLLERILFVRVVATGRDIWAALNEATPAEGETVLNTIPVAKQKGAKSK